MFRIKYLHSFIKRSSLILLILFFTGWSHASFHKSLWPKWEVNNPLSKEAISHQAWQDFLDRYVITNEEKINLINYEQLTRQDLESLKIFVELMSHINVDN